MRSTISKLLVVGCGSLLIGACSSLPDVDEVMGLGKNAPDESEVRVHQMLAMPPDYQLRPPADGSSPETGEANPLALPTLTPGGVAPAPDPNQPTQVANADPNVPGPQTITPGTNTQADPNTTQYGVSTVNPDGTPKSRRQIIDEINEKRVEEERKKNSSYGTIFNIGSLFSDW